MSLQEFQRAIAEFIASPERCAAAAVDFPAQTAGFDLTEREKRRLRSMVRDPLMSANCTLFRVNRLVPIMEVLPLTWRHLGAAAERELHAFWRCHPHAVIQYGEEAHRFGAWLENRTAAGWLPAGPALDALRFELTAFDLAVGAEARPDRAPAELTRQRLVRFDYDHLAVLRPGPAPAALLPLREPRWILLQLDNDELSVAVVQESVP
jgi:hypothetical protein